ncbi:MAG: hypothetical protein ACUZ8E_10745 [Candidatus Anammoxibacter sp.]
MNFLKSARWDPKKPGKLNQKIKDSFDDTVLKNKRNLLVVSLIASYISITGLLPSEFPALGLKFEAVDKVSFLYFFVATILYLIISFWIHVSPYLADIEDLQQTSKEEFHTTVNKSKFLFPIWKEKIKHNLKYQIWLFIEFRFPIVLGIFSICALSFRAIKI